MKIKALIPLGALLIASALAVSGMSNGWRRDDFIVTFDDCGGLLSDINISGAVFSHGDYPKSPDKLRISFDLNGGETVAAEVAKCADDVSRFYYGVSGPDGETELSLCCRVSLPDDAVLSDKNVNYDENGRAIMPDNMHAILYSDRIGYELYLTDFMRRHYADLGGVNILKADDKDGFRVMLTPARTAVYEADRKSATYLFSSDPESYHYEPSTLLYDINLTEKIDDNLAYIESVDDGIVWFVNPITKMVSHRDAEGKVTELFAMNREREVKMLVGEKDTVAMVTYDEENIYLSVDNSQEYVIKRGSYDMQYNTDMDVDISNGVATFFVSQHDSKGSSMRYILMDKNGLVTEWEPQPIRNDIDSIQFYGYSWKRKFDTYFDGERLYLLEGAFYSLSSPENRFDSNRDEAFGKYGGALTGEFVRVSILGRDGVIAERLAPLKVNVSRGTMHKTVTLKIGGRS